MRPARGHCRAFTRLRAVRYIPTRGPGLVQSIQPGSVRRGVPDPSGSTNPWRYPYRLISRQAADGAHSAGRDPGGERNSETAGERRGETARGTEPAAQKWGGSVRTRPTGLPAGLPAELPAGNLTRTGLPADDTGGDTDPGTDRDFPESARAHRVGTDAFTESATGPGRCGNGLGLFLDGESFTQLDQGPGEQPGDMHLGNSQFFPDLGLGHVRHETQREDLPVA